MNKQLEMVKQFHQTFGLGVGNEIKVDLGQDLNILRHKLLAEENNEYLEAIQENNLPKLADALGDMLYVLMGTIIEHGLQDKMEAVFEAIHKSNMSKLDNNGKPIYREDGKVMKGPNFFEPQIAEILK